MQARCRRAVGCTLPGICDLQMQPTALQFRAIIFKAKYTFCAAEIQRYYTSRCAPLCASIYYAWILRWYGWIDREIFFYVRDTENLLEKAGKINVLEIIRAFSVTKFKIDLQIHFWVNSLLLASSAYS